MYIHASNINIAHKKICECKSGEAKLFVVVVVTVMATLAVMTTDVAAMRHMQAT